VPKTQPIILRRVLRARGLQRVIRGSGRALPVWPTGVLLAEADESVDCFSNGLPNRANEEKAGGMTNYSGILCYYLTDISSSGEANFDSDLPKTRNDSNNSEDAQPNDIVRINDQSPLFTDATTQDQEPPNDTQNVTTSAEIMGPQYVTMESSGNNQNVMGATVSSEDSPPSPNRSNAIRSGKLV
jgi:hypothetical protein